MNPRFCNLFAIAPALLLNFLWLPLGTMVSQAQSSAYFNAMTNLNPVGYWPMHEVGAAAPGDIETNYGTLGALGNGFYPDWATTANGKGVVRGIPGALANDSDTAVSFTRGGSPAAGTTTNVVAVPHTSPLATLNPPFSVECWFNPTNVTSEDIWAQNGFEGYNAGGAGGGAGAVGGIRLTWSSGTNTGFQVFTFYNSSTLYSDGFSGNIGGSAASPTNQWYHLVVTCDASTNITLYVNGNYAFSTNAAGAYTPDYWSPFTIGGGRGGTRAVGGYIDEVAVYTNVLSDINTHYTDGISGGAGAYFHDVTNDNPVIYLRMDAPATYTAPSAATWPVVTNYGTTNGVAVGNGVYNPGTVPGVVTGPILNPNGVSLAGLPGANGNVAQLSGVSSFADVGNVPAYNPKGVAPFSVTALFKGNPCDGRVQTIVGHSDNSWNIIMGNTGHLLWRFGTNVISSPTSLGVYNDGNWHQVVAVYTPASVPTVAGTNALYVDGLLDYSTNNATTNGFGPGTNLDVLIGADPQYTNNPPGAGRQFSGKVCEVALFTNSLTAAQIQTLYGSLGVAPYVTIQPTTGRAVNGGPNTFILFGVLAHGSSPLAYQWYFNSSSNYSGATKLVDNVVHYTNSTTLQVTVTNLAGTDSGYYFVVITNNYGSVTSSLASLTVYAAPAIVSQLPVPYTNLFTLYAGASPGFSISAAGAQPIFYYWYTNGILDTAAANSSMVWTNVQAGSISNYCVASNFVGSATSTVWTASVLAAPAAPYPTNVLALHPVGYWRLNEGPDDGNGDDGVISIDYAGGNDGIYTNVVIGQSGYSPGTDPETSTVFGEFGSFPAINEYAGQIQGIDFAATNGANAEFTVEAWVNGVNSGLFPQVLGAPIATKGVYNVSDQFNLGIDSSKTHYSFYVRGATGAVYTVAFGSSPALDNNWHYIVGVCDGANGNLLLYFDGKLANRAAIPTNAGLYEVASPMTIGAGTGDGINYTNQFIGNINDVAVYNYALSFSQVVAQYSAVVGVPPLFSQKPPATMTLNAGDTLNLPAAALGTTPLGYYWFDVGGGTNVTAGSTNGLPLNATLTVSNVPIGWRSNQLELTVSNAYGSTNVFVSLAVVTTPQVSENLPSQVTVLSGASYMYSIGVIGPTPYSYQWYNAGTAISNQTNATYTLTAGNAGATTYYVIVTNTYGATTSSISTFTAVAAQFAPDLPPQVTLLSGKSYAYSVGIIGQMPYGSQWYNGGTRIANQTNSTYTATAGGAGSSSTYYVVVTNTYGAATSTVSTLTSLAQLTNAYAAGILQFHPAGYWPMHEVEPAVAGDIETNYGTLGLLGTAYYPDWVADGNLGGIVHNVSGALAGDSDTAVGFTHGTANAGTAVSFTNGLYIPHTSPLTTLNPPFTVECWFYPTNVTTGEAVWAQTGAVGLNDGAEGSLVNYSGIMLNWANGTLVPYGFNGQSGGVTANNGAKLEGAQGVAGGTPVQPVNQWCHVVVACDASTNFSLYANGSLVAGPKADVGIYSPDYWTPISIGCGNGGTRSSAGSIDEFAVYTTNLAASDIMAHYVAGTSSNPNPTYFQLVTNDNPVIYLRMDNAPYTASPVSMWPQLVNYGSATPNGVYAPGTMPGILAGPVTNSIPVGGLSGPNVALFGGVSSFADAGYDSAFNPTGTSKALSVTAWFRGNPADNRLQTLMGHSDNSWRINLDTFGKLEFAVGGDTLLTSTGVYNDGNWHQVVGVYDGSGGLEYLYVDGALDSSTVITALAIAGSTADVFIGSDPQYTNNPAGVGRQFAGQICEAAFFTRALTAAQAQDIYDEVIGPAVNTQPTNIVFSVSANQLTLSWPADHIGWTLQAQTNGFSSGLSTNWSDLSASTATNQMLIPINKNNGSVFYRLIYRQ